MPVEIDGLDPGDHDFIPGAERMIIENAGSPDLEKMYGNLKRRIESRWNDWKAERGNRGLEAIDGDLVLTRYGLCEQEDGKLYVPAFKGKFRPWVTTRPAFKWSDGREGEPLEGADMPAPDLYTLGTGALCFVTDGMYRYLVLGKRHTREVGGQENVVYDTIPAGFMKLSDLGADEPDVTAMERESREEFTEPDSYAQSGVMISDYWRNLTGCFDTLVNMKSLREKAEIEQEDAAGMILGVRWNEQAKSKAKSKYEGDGIVLIPEYNLGRFVSENTKRFGERAALLLKRYFLER